jgi:hypothetical protein
LSYLRVSLDLTALPVRSGVAQRIDSCSRCGATLSTHQPDVSLPERWIAACVECKSWFLMDCGAGVMVLLPDEHHLRDV